MCSKLEVFDDQWQAFAAQFVLYFEPGNRKFNLWNLSFVVAALKARFTFIEKGDTLEYGTLDERIWTQGVCASRGPLVWPLAPSIAPSHSPPSPPQSPLMLAPRARPLARRPRCSHTSPSVRVAGELRGR